MPVNFRKEGVDFAWDAVGTGVLFVATMPLYVRNIGNPPDRVLSWQTAFFGAYVVAASTAGAYIADVIRASI